MAKQMNIPVLGIVENMSYVECPDCGKKIQIFGESKLDETARTLGLPILGRLPIDPHFAALADAGNFEDIEKEYLAEGVEILEKKIK